MNLVEAIQTALANLAKHKLRSVLTMLGMIFGVGSVIAMLSIGGGAEKAALQAIDRLGIHNVLVKGKDIREEELREIRKKSLGVSLRDGEAIEEAVEGVDTVLPRVEIKTWKIQSSTTRTKAKVYGLSWKQPHVTVMPLQEGRFFDRFDEDEHAPVAVIGEAVKRDLFGFEPAVGRQIKVNDVWLNVIGVLAPADDSSNSVKDIPVTSSMRHIYMPFTTAVSKFDRDPLQSPLDELVVQLKPQGSTLVAASVIRPLLDRLHGGADDYELVVPEALLEQSRRTQRLFNIVMGSIAGISLLVGGIGIMNIMLASVLERTREIGVRRALGARPKDIRAQFVIESFAISFLGGIIGIILGLLLAKGVAAFAGWPTVVSIASIFLSTGVSFLVGWVSGIYPATRAASLDPIEALRYE
ncbi:MAG: ABC transporter permease [Acidobacteriota bacterium]